jgi:hypothetical protein
LALGAAFLRAARFSFFRSSLSSILEVSATWFLFRSNLFRVCPKMGLCNSKNNRVCAAAKAASAHISPRRIGFRRTMEIALNDQALRLSWKSRLLGSCLPIASDELRTARNNHPLTGVKSCVPTRYIAPWRRE